MHSFAWKPLDRKWFESRTIWFCHSYMQFMVVHIRWKTLSVRFKFISFDQNTCTTPFEERTQFNVLLFGKYGFVTFLLVLYFEYANMSLRVFMLVKWIAGYYSTYFIRRKSYVSVARNSCIRWTQPIHPGTSHPFYNNRSWICILII